VFSLKKKKQSKIFNRRITKIPPLENYCMLKINPNARINDTIGAIPENADLIAHTRGAIV
jgi:hypothetical protein